VNAGDGALVLDVRQTAEREGEVGILMPVRDAETGIDDVSVPQGQAFSGLPEFPSRVCHDMILEQWFAPGFGGSTASRSLLEASCQLRIIAGEDG
jgi:hypothetical protein